MNAALTSAFFDGGDMAAEVVLDSRAIEEAIALSLSCLRLHFRTTEDGRGGWYHYLDDQSPGVTASAVGLYCFRLAGKTFEHTDMVVKYLLSEQVTEGGKDHLRYGGWAIRTTNGVPVVEATAWVLRSLNATGISRRECGDAVAAGISWLEKNQNTDFGWGAYKGHPSRVYTTCMALLALAECGGPNEVVSNGLKWLNDSQSPGQPAWGLMPGGDPTEMHTAMAVLAQLAMPGALPAAAVKQSADWLAERLDPGRFVEKSTLVEDYDVPYSNGSDSGAFQISLPHFAGPISLHAMLEVGLDPFQEKIFTGARAILNSQEKTERSRAGTWELPRSPQRASIWAVWPFLTALTTVQRAVFPSAARQSPVESMVRLLYPGCVVVQTPLSPNHVTIRLLLRNAFFDWLRRRWRPVAMWTIIAAMTGIAFALWAVGQLDAGTFLLALVVPALLLVFQILWERRSK
jgi:Squalene-hopene cyclase C-terminal domain